MMRVKWWHSLPVRIWLAVLMLVLVLGGAMEWLWQRAEQERRARPPSEAVLTDADGVKLPARLTPMRVQGEDGRPIWAMKIVTDGGREMTLQWRSQPSKWLAALRPPYSSRWLLLFVGALIFAATGWIAWGATRRLMRLQRDIRRWSEGELECRADDSGHDEVATLAHHFNRAAAQIQTLVQEKDALLRAQKMMLANASHELRAPMNRILNAESLLSEGTPEDARWREEIRRSIGEMDTLTEEILDTSRLEAGQDDMDKAEELDLLGLVIEECLHEDVALKDARGRFWLNPGQESSFGETAFASSESDAPGAAKNFKVRGVPRLLRRALSNLLRNARRYGGADGICVTLDTEEGSALLHVDDSGPGVPEDEREDIFRPFYRAKSASESQGGWGLGLALVRTIAQRHGGSAECGDAPGGGARFTVRLPLMASTGH
ncbi:MAG: HAMP domain-containing histidine kinase [Ottowia sp.]|nr:HAMP domain-containing histidine kinase [Ottowia sp.]